MVRKPTPLPFLVVVLAEKPETLAKVNIKVHGDVDDVTVRGGKTFRPVDGIYNYFTLLHFVPEHDDVEVLVYTKKAKITLEAHTGVIRKVYVHDDLTLDMEA